jgi:tetraacyldisaccharide 4'-kinase
MSESFDTYAHGVMSGQNRSPAAVALRGITRLIEPFYATTMRVRNALYDRELFRSHRLSRPVISMGNITTGGTGKTPIVCWIASELIKAGYHPTVLMRGYKATAKGISDEASLMQNIVHVVPSRDRVAGASQALRQKPDIDVFILDDAFQHRRVERDLNLVLIDATSPFGFGHVLPRGMLREPLSGLRRADAVLVTRANQVSKERLIEISASLVKVIGDTTVLQASFALIDDEIRGKKAFVFCGIGNPRAFLEQVRLSTNVTGSRFFPDHHDYSMSGLDEVQTLAQSSGAQILVTTRKDWVKIINIQGCEGLPIVAVDQRVEMSEKDSERLLSWVKSIIVPIARGE